MRDHTPRHPATTTCAAVVAACCSRAFPATPDQVSQARRFLAPYLAGLPAADSALLCVSELASNAIQHSHSRRPGGRFTVSITASDDRMRVEVEDEGGPWHQQPRDGDLRGRGLTIVSALALWGVIGDGNGPRRVWFELPR
jgi:anti-sigma regulatory factor (Ser/Thr protein kinase)